MAVAALILGLLALLAARLAGPATELTGRPTVADGDSLLFGAERVRLYGIDAPELAQTCRRGGEDYECGRAARSRLVGLVAAGAVTCSGRERDRYGRLLARCTAAGGTDLGRAMVESGWAVAYGDYEASEAAARRTGIGLWSGTFEAPRDWRSAHGGLAEPGHGGLVARLLAWLSGDGTAGQPGDVP